MSIFFQSRPIAPAVRQALQEAFEADPNAIQDVQAAATTKANQVASDVQRTFVWGRFIAAVVILVVLFGAGVYTAQNDKLQDWSKALLHTFEILLGWVVGQITGEAVAKS